MKRKGLLCGAIALDILYGIIVLLILMFQKQIFHMDLYDSDIEPIYPPLCIFECIAVFAAVLVFSAMLLKKEEGENNRVEQIVMIVNAVALILVPVYSRMTNWVMTNMYSLRGVSWIAAYNLLNSYLSVANIFSQAAMVLVLLYTGITYGTKKR